MTQPGDDAPLHLIDLAEEIDPLAALVADDGAARTLSRRLDHPALRVRTALEVLLGVGRPVIAWGARAMEVARLGAAQRGVYRPSASDGRLSSPARHWRAAAATRAELERLVSIGWSAADCFVVPPPGVDPVRRGGPAAADGPDERGPALSRRVAREALGIGEGDFLWLLAGDSSPAAGLRDAVWATTLMHVMERTRRRHRVLLWGDRTAHRRARRFADQLGLPEMFVSVVRQPYDALTGVADAALLLPAGRGCAWSAAVVAQAGMPAVVNRQRDIQEVLGGRPGIRTAPGAQPRLIVREMLRLSEAAGAPRSPDDRYNPARVRELWRHHLSGLGRSRPEETAAGTSPGHH